MNEFTVVSPGFLGVLIAIGAGLWVVAWLTRRRRLLTLTALVPLALTWSLVSAAALVNAHYSYLPHVGDVTDVVAGTGAYHRLAPPDLVPANYRRTVHRFPSGGVVSLPIPDRGSGFGPSRALVYLPPQYFTQPTRRFATVYLIHGSPGSPADWFRGGEAGQTAGRSARAGRPVIVIAPRMSRRWTDDPECLDGLHEHVESHLVDDVVPTVDTDLRTVAAPADRALGGMSAGGFCALNLGLRHRNTFGAILDLSGLTHPTHAGGLSSLIGTGPAAHATALANSPDVYAATLPAGPRPRIWLDAGAGDREVARALSRMRVLLAADGFEVTLHLRPGGHSFAVWRPALNAALAWYTTGLEP